MAGLIHGITLQAAGDEAQYRSVSLRCPTSIVHVNDLGLFR
jgi:hypothetical protein